MILVAGGTGNLGRRVVGLLRSGGTQVRVLSRDASRASRLGDGVDVVAGDVRDRGSLPPAMEGVTTVVSAVHGFAGPGAVTPDSVDRLGNANLIAAATAAGVEHFILVSIAGARADSPMELFRAKHDAETGLRRSPLAWTIIRPTAYTRDLGDGHGRNAEKERARAPIRSRGKPDQLRFGRRRGLSHPARCL